MIFYVTLKKIRYGHYKQSVLMCGHRLIHGYKNIFDVKIELSKIPKEGSVVFVYNKPYMVSRFGGGKTSNNNGKTWKNTLSLVEINKMSIPKFSYHGNIYSCDVQQNSKKHYCPCELGCAII